MTSKDYAAIARQAIATASASESAYASALETLRANAKAAYAATVDAVDRHGIKAATVAKGSPVSDATVGDYLRAGRMHETAWLRLDTVRGKSGKAFSTLHGLIGGARQGVNAATGKGYGVGPIDALITEAQAATVALPIVEGTGAPDPARVARVWSAVVTRLADMAAERKAATPTPPAPPVPPVTPDTDEDTDLVTVDADIPASADARVAKLAAECHAVADLLASGAPVSREALAALYREASGLASVLGEITEAA
jgi:hypothetical protein